MAFAFGLALSAGAFAQITIPKPPIPNINLGSLRDLLFKEEAPLTSSMKDTVVGLTYMDGYELSGQITLTNDMRNAKGTWTLKPGHYTVDIQSFCGRGYSYGPTRGMGYVEGPWKGLRKDILQNVVRRYAQQTAISQEDTQLLIWSILAKTKPSKMRGPAKAAAVALLKPEEIASLEAKALDFLEDRVMRDVLGPVDRAMRPLYEAENNMRRAFYDANRPFRDFEALAMREVEGGKEPTTDIPRGRWNYHPSGYMMRYFPKGYSCTTVEVVVPHIPKIDRDAKGRIVRLECPPGWISEVEYNDELSPVNSPDGSGRVAYPFKLIRLIAPDKENPGQNLMQEFKDTGWCFVENPKEENMLLAALRPKQSGWFERWRDRAERIQEYRDRAEEAQRQAERMDRVLGGNASPDDFFDTGHYRDGLDAATSGSTGDRLGWIGEHHMRQSEALIFATGRIESLGEGTEMDPSEGVMLPANPGSQTLLGSPSAH